MFSEIVQSADPLTKQKEDDAIEEVEKILEETKTGIVLKDILAEEDIDSEEYESSEPNSKELKKSD